MTVARFNRAIRPVISTKNVVDLSGVVPAVTNTIFTQLIEAEDNASLADTDSVERGSRVNGIFLSVFAISEGGELANEVPLIDWYVIKNPGGNFTTFSATGFPTPGITGSHDNKRFIIHEEKGLSGGGELSLAGIPMVFKGVLAIPRGYRKFNANDRLEIAVRSNFAIKLCVKAIYKWYH